MVYSIDDPQKTVVVYKIGHRGEIYRSRFCLRRYPAILLVSRLGLTI